jgi:hypothetical protein
MIVAKQQHQNMSVSRCYIKYASLALIVAVSLIHTAVTFNSSLPLAAVALVAHMDKCLIYVCIHYCYYTVL